jgi:hypothetical protein
MINRLIASTKTIPRLIEELSQNITVSLFASDGHLTEKGTSTSVTVFETVNIYHFNQEALLITYGVAVFITVVCIVAGLLARRSNNGDRSMAYSVI